MVISDVTTAGSIPVLERVMQFAAQRQRFIANNIANISTPDYRPMDADPAAFQRALREAVERRRSSTGGTHGTLVLRDGRDLSTRADGTLEVRATAFSPNILFHDRNNRDLERTLQALVENTTTFRVAADLMRSRFELLRSAISERV